MLPLDKDLWQAVSPLLDRALDQEPAARAALVAEIERERPDLARMLLTLLEEHDRLLGSDFLESSPGTTGEPLPSLAGQSIGPYTLEAPIGMGGMGTVWRGRRSDGRFEGFVAIKLLNLALVGRGGDERFRREGTLLARIAHPHIARLLDAGVTSTGQPYLVLEYVEGIRIDQFADQHRLTPATRLELFLQVAGAVAHAHASLIVHRDLKPSNVLVTADGQVKLLDFGIGKLLAAQSDGLPSESTQAAAQAMTPEYAAPEQARGEDITTATDVYALGVLLYLLLTGRHPTGSRCRTPAEHLHALLEHDPVRASDAVMAPPDDAVARAAWRQSTPERLRRLYRGDIDNLLAKALEKRPDRRYASVAALSDDIGRFQNHDPLSVHGHAWSYRAAKFGRRHRWPIAAAIVTFTMLSTGLYVANRQRLIAESRFRQLRQLSEQVFLLDTSIRTLPGSTEARRALVAASLEYLEGLAADARDDLDLMQEVSDGYARVAVIQGVPTMPNLGNLAQAEQSLHKAETLVDTILAARPHDRRALETGAFVAQDRMIVAQTERRDEDARAHAQTTANRIEALLRAGGPTEGKHDQVSVLYANVALAYVNMQMYDEGIRSARRQLDIASMLQLSPNGRIFARASALSVLANALRLQGDLEGALKAIREAREIVDRSTSSNETQRMLDRYGILLREGFILGEDRGVSLERPEEAIAPLREAFDMTEALARRDPNEVTSRTRVGTSGRELGDILRWRDPQEAMAIYDVALRRLGEVHNNVRARRDRALVLVNSSYALRRLNRPGEAKRRIDEAFTILTETKDYPSDRISLDSELRAVLQALADHHADERQPVEAIDGYEQLLQKVLASEPDVENDLRDAYSLALLYGDLARLYRSAGRSEQAAATDAENLALWRHWDRKLPDNAFVARRLAELRD